MPLITKIKCLVEQTVNVSSKKKTQALITQRTGKLCHSVNTTEPCLVLVQTY